MLNACRRLLSLRPADRALLLQAYVGLAATDIALRRRGFQRYLERLQRLPATQSAGPEALARAERFAHWIAVSSHHHVVPARCLHRSLLLYRWLRTEGLPGELRIGVRTEHGRLAAHAWVELDGQVVNDDPRAVQSFARLAGPAGLSSLSAFARGRAGLGAA